MPITWRDLNISERGHAGKTLHDDLPFGVSVKDGRVAVFNPPISVVSGLLQLLDNFHNRTNRFEAMDKKVTQDLRSTLW